MNTSITRTKGNAACLVGANAKHAPDAARSDSRLVIRDERVPTGIPLVTPESLVTDLFPNFEAEIYRLEARGQRAELIAHPVPLAGANSNAAHIDWFACTVPASHDFAFGWIGQELQETFGFGSIAKRKTGLYGYKESALIEDGGLVAWGGKNQRGTVYVSLNGLGCSRIRSWATIHDWCVQHNARLTRVDPAHDDLQGTAMSIDKAHALWVSGGFNGGGRRPSAHPAGDWWGLSKGRTVYIGERGNGKLLRVYEKGKQLGDVTSTWVRIELELHNKSRVIPLDILLKPGAYLAGAYPCLAYLSDEQCKVKIIRKAATISFDRAIEVLKLQYGKLIHFMVEVYGGDLGAVVAAVQREGLPARMEEYAYQLRNDPGLLEALATRAIHEASDPS